ncbi:hypothetical protein KI387_041319 [Taxus chinensis]|uniref:Pentatricopeptide repeat-containing protein n=1 Tax=Taxus chinensis TaxID=29808 RepID=A0AA38C6L1_TAXCH|nr:hypothetical protein KI387_041319 [Taxus chinensis]
MQSISHLNQTLRILCTQGHLKEAIHILLTIHNPTVDFSTYILLLRACTAKNALSEGKQIHSRLNDSGLTFASNTLLPNTLIHMYDKCGSLMDARKVFNLMTEPNIFSWNMIIAAYRRHGFTQQAFTLFCQMQQTAVQPDEFTFSTILPVCANMASVKHGSQIHGKIIRCKYQFHDIVMNTLIDMYSKCGRIDNARELFDEMLNTNGVSWNAMITGFAQSGFLDEALRLFEKMSHKNVVSWTAIISGYAQNGFVEKALEIAKRMQLAGVKPDSLTFASILPVCTTMGALEKGIEIHQKLIETRFLTNVVVMTALIDMYAKCGRMEKAHKLFDEMPQRNVVSWTAIIAGYAQNGQVGKALDILNQMQLAGTKPSSSTFVSILPACAKMGALEEGMDIHQKIIENGYLSDVVVVTSLIDMYAKCGSMHEAQELFNKMQNADVISWNTMIAGYAQNGVLDEALSLFKEMPHRNTVSWNAIIAGYAQNGLVEKAVEIFKKMQWTDINPDKSTFASILPVCAKMGALEQGMELHQKIIQSGFLSDVVVTALIDMYSKCGSIKNAHALFEKMKPPDVASWNAMVAGYAMHGHSKDALKIFELMKHTGTNPNHVSFVCILFACSHAGLVDDSCRYFNQMTHSYCIRPTIDHYVCMVDLLGRAGCFEEALNFIIKMPIKPDSVVWLSLLGACRSHKNMQLGDFVASLLFQLDPTDAAPYVILSNIYARASRWTEAQKKTDHSHKHEIHASLEKLSWKMKTIEYIPDTRPVLNDVEEEKEFLVDHHGEKLGMAFGLLNTPGEQLLQLSITFQYVVIATLQPSMVPRLFREMHPVSIISDMDNDHVEIIGDDK